MHMAANMTRQSILALTLFGLIGCANDNSDFDSDADAVNAAIQSSDEGGGAADRLSNARFVAGTLAIGVTNSKSFPATSGYDSYMFTVARAQPATVTLGSTDGMTAVQLNIYGPLGARGWPSSPVASKVGRLARGRSSASYTFTPRAAGTYLALVVRHSSSVSTRCIDECPYTYTIALTCRTCGVSCGGFVGGVCPIGSSCPDSGGPGSQPAGICLPTVQNIGDICDRSQCTGPAQRCLSVQCRTQTNGTCSWTCPRVGDTCRTSDCGPPIQGARMMCEDGSYSGPTGRCVFQEAGTCRWEVRSCPQATDCRQNGCASGTNCQLCWASWQCVPNGAVC